MSKNVTIKCDNCGARLPPQPPQKPLYTCSYCGHQFRVGPAPPPQPSVPPAVKVAVRAARAQAKGARWGAIVPFLIVLLVGGGIALYTFKVKKGGSSVGSMGEHLIWDTVGGPPQVVQIDGKEHFLGRVRSISDDHQLSIMVLDAETMKTRWRSQPLGKYITAYRGTHFAAAAGRVVISDIRGQLHVHDLGTGKVLKALKVTDRVKQLCPVQGAKVWVQVADKRHVMADLERFAVEEAPRPDHCPRSVFMARHRERRIRKKDGPRVSGFKVTRLHVEGELGVAAGVKHPGTKIPIAVGYDPKTLAVRWKKEVATTDRTSVRENDSSRHDDLAGGRYVAVYGVGSDFWRVVAFDAKTGTHLWDKQLRPLFAVDRIKSLQASPTRVYVMRTSSLEVHDIKNGNLVGTVGRETYD